MCRIHPSVHSLFIIYLFKWPRSTQIYATRFLQQVWGKSRKSSITLVGIWGRDMNMAPPFAKHKCYWSDHDVRFLPGTSYSWNHWFSIFFHPEDGVSVFPKVLVHTYQTPQCHTLYVFRALVQMRAVYKNLWHAGTPIPGHMAPECVYTFRDEFKIGIFLQNTENPVTDHRVSHPRIPVLQGSQSFMCSHTHECCVCIHECVCVCMCVCMEMGEGFNFEFGFMYFGSLPKGVQYKRSPDASNVY